MLPELIAAYVAGIASSEAGKWLALPSQVARELAAEKLKRRLSRVQEAAEAKSQGRPLEVNDRVGYRVLGEAAVIDDEVIADYLGGVLAASSFEEDNGAAIAAQIGRLSARSLRLHYMIYRELRNRCTDRALNLYQSTQAARASVRIPSSDLEAVLGREATSFFGSILQPLIREGLVGEFFSFGPNREGGQPPHEWSLHVTPTAAGAELFLWGHGSRATLAIHLFSPARMAFLAQVPETPGVTIESRPPPAFGTG